MRAIYVAMAHASSCMARVHVVTVSDTRTLDTDESGRLCLDKIALSGHVVSGYTILPDEATEIQSQLALLRKRGDTDAVLMNGGTGISGRDTTFEAVSSLMSKRLDGFGELFRMLSYAEIGARAMASRALAGTMGQMLLFAMPGSPKAVRLAMDKLILPELGHLVGELRK